jgi:hypothetical protein
MPTVVDTPHTTTPARRSPRSPRQTVALLARPGVDAAREAYLRGASDALRVAALVEVAAAAAALARTVIKYRHLDPALLLDYVGDPVDLYAVLGRGRWLPTMTRHVPAPPSGPVPVGLVLPVVVDTIARRRPRPVDAAQLALFPTVVAGGEA